MEYGLKEYLLGGGCSQGASMVKNLPANVGDTIQPLILDDPTCHRATTPMSYSY